uniref:Uncharacterized protein n=1 Tax=Siphoviridae sp. ctfeV1 TaxID=2826417 RepID=A0A8S5MRM0_9CAUD|nr:MAG TPA: hypothetical protein [Siphoviridae sp. ctfeV1]
MHSVLLLRVPQCCLPKRGWHVPRCPHAHPPRRLRPSSLPLSLFSPWHAMTRWLLQCPQGRR